MAIIGDPFAGNATPNINKDDLIQALRLDLINEYEAIIGYEAHAASTADQGVKKALNHIAQEEKSHVGILEQLINMLSPNDAQFIDKGRQTIVQQQAQNFNVPFQN